MRRREVLVLGLAALSTSALPRLARAQSKYPDRPIRLVIPFTPGGVNDAVGRPWADKMKPLLGTVVVENIGGAGGGLGAAAVARAKPDGYTLLLGGMGSQVIVGVATNRANYDPMADFDPIALLGVTALTIAVHPSVPAKTLTELIAYGKANPGKLSFGSRMLCVTSPTRLAAFPSLPTAVEAGLPNMVAQNFIGLFAPAKTPREIIDQIAQATRAAMADQQFQQAFIASGFDPYLDSTPEKTRRFVEDEIARWTPIIKAIGLKLD